MASASHHPSLNGADLVERRHESKSLSSIFLNIGVEVAVYGSLALIILLMFANMS